MSALVFDPDAPASGSGLYGLPHSPDDAGVVIIPVPWEATVSYRAGTARGPAAILAASRQVDLTDRETGTPYAAGIAMLPEDSEIKAWSERARALAAPIIEAGGAGGLAGPAKNLAEVNRLGERLNERVRATAEAWLGRGKLVGLVGGDHSTPFGLIAALAARHPGMGILHLDAHADLREAYEGFTFSHASIMFNVMARIPGVTRLVQVGVRDFGRGEADAIAKAKGRIVTCFENDLQRGLLAGKSFNTLIKPCIAKLPKAVYLSFDIDGLDPQLCPHTGTPVPGGLSFAQACALIRMVAESGRTIVGFDLNEVAPGPDGDEWDANVGARLLYKQIGWALKSRAKKPKRRP